MRTQRVAVVIALIVTLSGSAGLAIRAADISGTWSFSVDVGETHGDPTFVFIADQGDGHRRIRRSFQGYGDVGCDQEVTRVTAP